MKEVHFYSFSNPVLTVPSGISRILNSILQRSKQKIDGSKPVKMGTLWRGGMHGSAHKRHSCYKPTTPVTPAPPRHCLLVSSDVSLHLEFAHSLPSIIFDSLSFLKCRPKVLRKHSLTWIHPVRAAAWVIPQKWVFSAVQDPGARERRSWLSNDSGHQKSSVFSPCLTPIAIKAQDGTINNL